MRALPLAATALALLAAAPARAQLAQNYGGGTVLPATGTSVRLGDIRQQVEGLVRPPLAPAAGAPAFLVVPSINASIGLTDNAAEQSSHQSADIFGLLTPGLTVIADTARLKGTLTYAPTASVYATTQGRSYIAQNLGGNATATIVPNAVFVDMRASITQQSRTGALAALGNQTLPRGQSTQSSSFSITPYAVNRFGGWGTSQVSYGLSYSANNGNTGTNGTNSFFNNTFNANAAANGNTSVGPAPQGAGNTYNPYFANQNVLTNHERAQFTTGENLGRINAEIAADAKQFVGNGIYRGAYRNFFTLDGAYALDRKVAAIARIGYEDLRYGGVPVFRVTSPVWYAGFRWTPNADSTITARYGRRDGIESAYLDASYAPTARTRVYANYSTGLTSEAEEQQSLLALANFDPGGFATNAGTGAPITSSGSFFGTQNTLYILRRFSITGVLLRDRDTYSLSVNHQSQHVVAGSAALSGNNSSSGTFGSITWQHELSPKLSSTVLFQYGVDSPLQVLGAGQDTLVTADAALTYSINPTLSTSASYTYTNRSGGGINSHGYTEDILLFGIHKGF